MITGSLTHIFDKNRLYNTNFELYPKSYRDPEILDRPSNKFKQETWLSQIVFDQNSNSYIASFQNNAILFNTVTMVEGTKFSIDLTVVDPTILSGSMLDDRNLEYAWLKNDGVLHEFSNINNYKGTNKMMISSESCTRDISGTYQLRVTNVNTKGVVFSEPLNIDVLDIKNHPKLYKNLIINSCGERDMGEWVSDPDIIVNRFNTNGKNHPSIDQVLFQISWVPKRLGNFQFKLIGTDTLLARQFNNIVDPTKNFYNTGSNSLAYYNRWIMKSFKSTLVPTDGDLGGIQGFYPSFDYIDSYNKNNNLIKLNNIITKAGTYITRDRIKFITYGGKAVSTTKQAINVSDLSDLIDGRCYGINTVFAHFFAYVGIGISNYKLEYVDAAGNSVEENIIPKNMFYYKLSALNDKPPFIPLNPITKEATTQQYGYTANGKDNNLTAAQSLATLTYSETKRDKYSVKIKKGTKIQLTPICYDTANIRLDFLDQVGDILRSDIIEGPTAKDIWAVKEKFYMSWHLANLYGWQTDASDQMFYFYSQSFTTMNAIRNLDTPGIDATTDLDSNVAWIKKYHYPLFDDRGDYFRKQYDGYQNMVYVRQVTRQLPKDEWPAEKMRWDKDSIISNYDFDPLWMEKENISQITLPIAMDPGTQQPYDNGASAFFGIHKDIEIPIGTKSIVVNVLFNHESEEITDQNPKSKNWEEKTIYHNIFSKVNPGDQFFDYNYPRTAVTAMHLSLHPNTVTTSEDYNTYVVMKSSSVWGMELARLESPTEYNTIVPAGFDPQNLVYKYNQSTIPVEPYSVGSNSIPTSINTAEILFPNLLIVPPAIQPPTPPTPPPADNTTQQVVQPIPFVTASTQMSASTIDTGSIQN